MLISPNFHSFHRCLCYNSLKGGLLFEIIEQKDRFREDDGNE